MLLLSPCVTFVKNMTASSTILTPMVDDGRKLVFYPVRPSSILCTCISYIILYIIYCCNVFFPIARISCTGATTYAATGEFLQQLSRPGAIKASTALCGTSARVLIETRHRPARRQAAVIVANLVAAAELRAALLAICGDEEGHNLVDSLVSLAMGDDRCSREGCGAVGDHGKEEEIGTRRECMRALVGLAECRAVRDLVRASDRPCD